MSKIDPEHFMKTIQERLTSETIAGVDNHITTLGGQVVTDPAHKEFDLSEYYPVVRPVLVFVQGLLFFKHQWAIAIDVLIKGLDAEYLPVEKPAKKLAKGTKPAETKPSE